MQDIISNILTAGASSGVTGSLICLLLKSYLNNRDKERDQLVNDVQKLSETIRVLKDENVRKLEVKIETHIGNDRNQEIITKLNAIGSRQVRIEDEVGMQSKSIASLVAKDEARYQYLENIDKSFQAHKREHKA
jgi:hypothetical protein